MGAARGPGRSRRSELRQCGACLEGVAAHAADPVVRPGTSPANASKTGQNKTCGKCHFNQDILGRSAINPDDKHALFMSVGFEGKKQQLSCLDCHSGHKGGSDMLVSIKAHICFTCHKTAIVTMGIFQPFNYLTFGKMRQGCHAVHGGSSGAPRLRAGGRCVRGLSFRRSDTGGRGMRQCRNRTFVMILEP